MILIIKIHNLVPNPTVRLFQQRKINKFTSQPLGKNFFQDLPKFIAKQLELPESNKYMGHAFHRSATTNATENGVSKDNMMHAFHWESASVAKTYIKQTDSLKCNIWPLKFNIQTKKIILNSSTPLISSPALPSNVCKQPPSSIFSGCAFHGPIYFSCPEKELFSKKYALGQIKNFSYLGKIFSDDKYERIIEGNWRSEMSSFLLEDHHSKRLNIGPEGQKEKKKKKEKKFV